MASADLDDNVAEAFVFSLLARYSNGYFAAALFIIITSYAPSILLTRLATTSLMLQISTSPCLIALSLEPIRLSSSTRPLSLFSGSVLYLSYLALTATDLSMDDLSRLRFHSAIPWFDET